MPSLFQIAYTRLCDAHSDFAQTWTQFAAWLEDSATITEEWDRNALHILKNIEAEGAFSTSDNNVSEEFEKFLLFCSQIPSDPNLSEDQRKEKFKSLCQDFSLSGRPIPGRRISDVVHRYTGDYLLVQLTLRPGNEMLYDQLQEEEVDYEQVTKKLALRWSENSFSDNEKLHRDPSIFATTNDDDNLHQSSANEIADRLALPAKCIASYYQESSPMLRLTYRRDALHQVRYPTVADAGNYTYFSPTPLEKVDDQQTGLTKPFNEHLPPCREFVHANTKANVIIKPLEWIGFVEG